MTKRTLVEGTIQPGFEPVREAFASLWNEIEVGAGLSIFLGDELVVDLWGGHTNRDRTIPWQRDTLVNTYSISKGIVSLALACLVDEGKLDYDNPVADYWTQFGAERKFGITVTQALSHQAGVYTFRPAVEPEDLYNWQKATFNVASQAPAWEPGTAFGYHAITWGYIAGELIRQTTGRTIGDYLRSRITNQLEADFHIGLTGPEQKRCAEMIGPNHARPPVAKTPTPGGNTLPKNDPALPPYRVVSSADWRNAEIPATNGHGSSLGIARCYQAAISGKLFSGESLQLALKEETNGETDLCLNQVLRRSKGFILNCEPCYYGPSRTAFGHAGTGGSTAFADPENNVAFAYVTNQLHHSGTVRYRKLIDAFFDCLKN
ncbi:MAG: beta-lactamase family protein [Gammaproteobacteria bacterium]|nr:beta-lactamase family protein [Gammaproteobacteria bacterium]